MRVQTPEWSHKLREAREALHLSQRALAEQAGVSPGTVKLYETGRRRTGPMLTRLLDALKLEQIERNAILVGAGFVPEPAPIAVEAAYEEPAPAESVHEIRLEPAAAEPAPVEAPPPAPAKPARFDVDSLPDDLKQLHHKAKRFAKVTVSDLMLYKKSDVEKGRQNKDLYSRLKKEIDDSKAMYDKRFAKIAAHNVDYLYDEMVRVLAENDPQALGSYPYRPAGA